MSNPKKYSKTSRNGYQKSLVLSNNTVFVILMLYNSKLEVCIQQNICWLNIDMTMDTYIQMVFSLHLWMKIHKTTMFSMASALLRVVWFSLIFRKTINSEQKKNNNNNIRREKLLMMITRENLVWGIREYCFQLNCR